MNETIKRKLTSDETVLVGAWLQDGEKIQADQVCQRIEWLTNTVLDQISINGDEWTAMYKDPVDGRIWELSYPESHMYGAGPPRLDLIR